MRLPPGALLRRTCDLAVCGLIALALGLALLAASPAAWANDAFHGEAGISVSGTSRQRQHEDTGGFGSKISTRGWQGFADAQVTTHLAMRLEHRDTAWKLTGPEADPRIDLRMLNTRPRLTWRSGSLEMRLEAESVDFRRRTALYAPIAGAPAGHFLLPGVSAQWNGTDWRLQGGGWQEWDILTVPDLTFAPSRLQNAFVQVTYLGAANHELSARLADVRRVEPAAFPLERYEYEMDYRRLDPLERKDAALWKDWSISATYHDYTGVSALGADSWFVAFQSQLRTSGWGLQHVIVDRVTATNALTVFRSGALPSSIVEVDKTGFDLWNRLEYTVYTRLGAGPVYWDSHLTQDESLARRAYREWRIRSGLKAVF